MVGVFGKEELLKITFPSPVSETENIGSKLEFQRATDNIFSPKFTSNGP